MVEISGHDHSTGLAGVEWVFVPVEGFSWSASHSLKEGGMVDERNSFFSTDLGKVHVGVLDSTRHGMTTKGRENGGGF
mgnify:CR=1 FL=1